MALPTPLITLDNAAFGYNGRPIVSHVSLRVMEGEFTGLIGPNGAGKSTLFKGILKLLTPLSGTVVHAEHLARRVGYVPQRDTLDPIYPLTARDVVHMGFMGPQPWYRQAGRRGWTEIDHCLEKVGMEDFRDHPFAQLSGGQRQRVLIARALALDPQLLILDEPTAGIDPIAEESVLNLLQTLHRQAGLTILMVSHHLQALRQRVQRIIVVNNRGIVDGPAEEMLAPDRIIQLMESGL